MSAVAVYAVASGPWGPLHVAVSERGVVALEILSPTDAFVARLEARLLGEVRARRDVPRDRRSVLLDRAVAEVAEFVAGRRRAFDLPIDVDDRPAWDRAVLARVRCVRWGEVSSYGRVAAGVGRPGAARAVGGAVGRNPVGLLVPCHRVIAGDGGLGGYGGDWYGTREVLLAIKRELLEREGISLPVRAFPDRALQDRGAPRGGRG